MKKLFAGLLVALLVPLSACAEMVVTSFYPIYLLALNLTTGIDAVEVVNLAPPGTGCLHDYQLTTGDMKALAGADVFLINGAGMESYLTHVMDALPTLPVVDASTGIDLLPDTTGEMAYNAHIWLDAANAARMAENLATGLAQALPAHADKLAENAAALSERLLALDAELRAGLEPVTGSNIVTFHEAFPYFAKAYGLHVAAVVALEPGDALSPRQLADLVETVRRLNNPPLFTEPQYQDIAARTVSAETGAPIYELDPCVTGPETDISPDYYEQVMRRNMSTLLESLGESS